MQDQRFIVWDPKDGEPFREQDGRITSSGAIGVTSQDNIYITAYAQYAEGTKLAPGGFPELEVGQFAVATFSLSGSKGTYRVYRVE